MSDISGVDVSLITSIGGVDVASIKMLCGLDIATYIPSFPGQAARMDLAWDNLDACSAYGFGKIDTYTLANGKLYVVYDPPLSKYKFAETGYYSDGKTVWSWSIESLSFAKIGTCEVSGPSTLIDQQRLSFGTQVYPSADPGYPDIYYLLGYINIDPTINGDNAIYKGYIETSWDLQSWYNQRVFLPDFQLDEKTSMPLYNSANGLIIEIAYRAQGYMNDYFRVVGYPIFGDYTTYFVMTMCAGDTSRGIDPFLVSLEQYYQGNMI